jgi:hypothetical protein
LAGGLLMRRRRITRFVIYATIPFVMWASPAWAGIAASGWGYFAVNVDYRCVSVIHTSAPGDSAWAFAETWVGPRTTAVGKDWVAANARLFNSGGALVLESGFTSNPYTIVAGSTWDAYTGYYNHAGTYRSWGVVKAFNVYTNAYEAYYAPTTGSMATGTS